MTNSIHGFMFAAVQQIKILGFMRGIADQQGNKMITRENYKQHIVRIVGNMTAFSAVALTVNHLNLDHTSWEL